MEYFKHAKETKTFLLGAVKAKTGEKIPGCVFFAGFLLPIKTGHACALPTKTHHLPTRCG